MRDFLWPSEDGWPYPDPEARDVTELADTDEIDDELLSLRIPAPHLFDDLDPTERAVVTGRFGLDGTRVRTLNQLHAELGLPRAQIRGALESGLAKLRTQLI